MADTVVCGTANILVTLDSPAVETRFERLVDTCDVLALQEWPRGRNDLLAAQGRLFRWWPLVSPHDLEPRGRWSFHRAHVGGGPIGVRNSLHETPLACWASVLARAGRVDKVPGRRSYLGPSWCTRLKSRRRDGSVVVRYNLHLTAGVQIGHMDYRADRPKRVARHRDRERPRIGELVGRDLARGFDVEVYGDDNFHHMRIGGLTAWWATEPGESTFGNRAIDGIWTTRSPDSVTFLPALVPGEHRHVIAHYS